MTEARFANIPDPGRSLPRVNSHILAVRAVIGTRPFSNGIHPASISARWGILLHGGEIPVMRQQFHAAGVYDPPTRGEELPLRQRPGPFRAEFDAGQPDVVSQQLLLGGYLRVLRDGSPALHTHTHGLKPHMEPDRTQGTLYTMNRLMQVNGNHRGGIEVRPHDLARLVLGAFAQAVMPPEAEADAAWLAAQLMPPSADQARPSA